MLPAALHTINKIGLRSSAYPIVAKPDAFPPHQLFFGGLAEAATALRAGRRCSVEQALDAIREHVLRQTEGHRHPARSRPRQITEHLVGHSVDQLIGFASHGQPPPPPRTRVADIDDPLQPTHEAPSWTKL